MRQERRESRIGPVATGPANPMCADDSDDPVGPDPSDTSEHATRNRTQLELLKLALERQRHRAHIDAMLERTAPARTDADSQSKNVADEPDDG